LLSTNGDPPEVTVSTHTNAPKPAPPRHKIAVVTWLGAYGMITLILAVLGPTIAAWPLPLRTLLLSTLMVSALTWVVLPTLTRVFRPWLVSTAAPAKEAPGHVGRVRSHAVAAPATRSGRRVAAVR
jgi:antibiotic biosynthesis monooxygenase (ABM) superfamily enzyme